MHTLLVQAAAAVLALVSTGLAQASNPAPHSLAVTPRDASLVYGGKFLLEAASTVANTQANILPTTTHLPSAMSYRRHGRITGYLTFLGRPRTPTGNTLIFSDVDRYRTGSGPRWAIQYTGAMGGSYRTQISAQTLTIHGLGEEAYLTVYQQPPGAHGHLLFLSFRQREYLVTIGVSGPVTLREREVLRLARIVDQRIARTK